LKLALLVGFNKTPETYGQEFRSLKISPNETYEQFSVKLSRTLDYWIEARQVERTYESLRAFILSDQMLASVTPDLRCFLKEHNAHTLPDLVRLADNWATARRAYPKTNSVSSDSRPPSPGPPNSSTGPNYKTSRMRPMQCHACGSYGHMKSQCPKNPSSFYERRSQGQGNKINFCLDETSTNRYMCCGTVNGANVSTILRDTGCSCVVVSEEVLPDVDVSKCKFATISDFLGRKSSFPVVPCYLRCKYYTGWTNAIRAPIKFCSVLLGNINGVTSSTGNEVERDLSQ
jgi:hypothetical protein